MEFTSLKMCYFFKLLLQKLNNVLVFVFNGLNRVSPASFFFYFHTSGIREQSMRYHDVQILCKYCAVFLFQSKGNCYLRI